MAKQRAEDFVNLVRASKLVPEDQLDQALAELQQAAGGMPVTNAGQVAIHLVDKRLLTQWQADRLQEGKHKGFFLGKYKLLDHLGTGGMSQVFLAEHMLLQTRRAIKILPKRRVDDTSYLERFYREARAAAALDDPNVVRAYDVDMDPDSGIHFLVMDYVEGSDLQAMVKRKGTLDYPAAADYIRQAARGLSHAHKVGLIHRDVKPANLLVDPQGVVKVLDLGLAKFSDEDKASLTVAYDENVLGTADYLAPEQALNSHGVDGRADIYSLGCTLYYVLTGQPPFPEGTLPQRIMCHQKTPPPDIREKRPDAPVDLLKICAKMMAKKPEQRFQKMSDVAKILTRWLVVHGHEKPGDPAADSSSTRLGRAARQAQEMMGRGPAGPTQPGSTAPRRQTMAPASPSHAPGDTLKQQQGQSTFKGPGSRAGRAFSGSSSASGRMRVKMETKPPAEAAKLEELLDPMQVSFEAPVLPASLAEADSPGIARLRQQRPARRRREPSEIPGWVWAMIGAVAFLLVILLAVAILG
ncbi:MAG: serine/threonine protein kinase [Pirellulales bacterium]|nr:serine/threonine protein kinase [Pirellulales bacterium]